MLPEVCAESVTVVVPIGPGDQAWRTLAHHLPSLFPATEIVLSTCEPLADVPPGVVVVSGCAGRASQQNRGARAATKDWLWFLHADTVLTPEVVPALCAFVAGPPDRIGYFRLGFQADGPRLVRLNALGANVRSRWLGLPFGDQGLILSRALWQRLGGFDEGFGLGEDLEFVIRARSCGMRLVQLAGSLLTSARRYRDHGWLETTIRHAWLTIQQVRRARRPDR